MRVLLVIPAFNEEKSIEKTVEKIEEFKKKNQLTYTLDYVVINDGSTDDTGKVLDRCVIKHVDLINNLGIGGAVQTGYMYAKDNDYDVAVQFDGDGQHDIESLNKIVEPVLHDEYDFVIGSRFVENVEDNFKSTFMRRLGIVIISLAIQLVCREKVYDTTSGFRAANKKAIVFLSMRYPVSYPEPESIVHLLKNKFRIGERAVKMYDRTMGISSIRALTSATYMIEVVTAIFISGFMKEGE
jgi:glycosyltransferase involved in cell wall biosynthesis